MVIQSAGPISPVLKNSPNTSLAHANHCNQKTGNASSERPNLITSEDLSIQLREYVIQKSTSVPTTPL